MNTTPATRLTADILGNHGGARLIINGRKCAFSSVRSYTLYNNAVYGEDRDPAEREAQAAARGHELYWINLESTTICGDRGYYEREAAKWADAPRLSTGDVVEFEGKRFWLKPTFNGNFSPVAIVADEVAA
jgi:hypothetical protein